MVPVQACSYTWLQLPEAPPHVLSGAEAARARSASPSVPKNPMRTPEEFSPMIGTDSTGNHGSSCCKQVTLEPCHSPPRTLLAKSLPCHTPGTGGLTPTAPQQQELGQVCLQQGERNGECARETDTNVRLD